MKLSLLFEIFLSMAKVNLLGYGGGPAMIPLIEAEVVKHKAWMNAEQFASALAVGNALPGPIATKIATFTGHKVAGVPGALSALLGTVAPTAILMVVLAALLTKHQNVPFVKGMIKAVKAVVFVLFAMLTVEFFEYAWPPASGWIPALVAVASFIGIYFFNLHQAWAVLGALIVGALLLR